MTRFLLTLAVFTLFPAGLGFAATNTGARFALQRKPAFHATQAIPAQCDNPGTSQIEPNYSPNYDETPCDQYTVTAPAPGASTVYLVIGHADALAGVAGVSFGIDYDGRDPDGQSGTGDEFGIDPQFVSFWSCADGIVYNRQGPNGDWLTPQSAARITWNDINCSDQKANDLVGGTLHAVVGAFYLYAYSEDVFRITVNNTFQSGPELAIADCNGSTTNLLDAYPPALYSTLMGKVHFGGNGTQGYNPCAVTPVQPTTWGSLKNKFGS